MCRPLWGQNRPLLPSDAGVVTAATLSLAGAHIQEPILPQNVFRALVFRQ